MGLLIVQLGSDQHTVDSIAFEYLQAMGLQSKDHLGIDCWQLDLQEGVENHVVALLVFALGQANLRIKRIILHHSVLTEQTMTALVLLLWRSCSELDEIDLTGTVVLSKVHAAYLSNLCLRHQVDLKMDAPMSHLVSHPAIMPAYDGLTLLEQHGGGASGRQGGPKAVGWKDQITGIEVYDPEIDVKGFVDLLGLFKNLPQLNTFVWRGGLAWTLTHLAAVMSLVAGDQGWRHLAFDGVALGQLFGSTDERNFIDALQALDLGELSLRDNGFEPEHVFVLACLFVGTRLQLAGNPPGFLAKLALIAPQYNQRGELEDQRSIEQPYDEEGGLGTRNHEIFAAKLDDLKEQSIWDEAVEDDGRAHCYLDFRTQVGEKAKSSLPSSQPLLREPNVLSVYQCQCLMQWLAEYTVKYAQDPKAKPVRLFLAEAGLGDKHLIAINEVLRGDPLVDTLDLSGNNDPTIKGWWLIARGLQASTHVRRLVLRGIQCFGYADVIDMQAFLRGLADCVSLSQVDMTACVFNRNNLKALLAAMLNSKQVCQLDLSHIAWQDSTGVSQEDIEGILNDIFLDDPHASLGVLKTILLQHDGGGVKTVLDISAVFKVHLGVVLEEGEESLAPLCDFVRHSFPVMAPNKARCLAIMNAKIAPVGDVTLDEILNVASMGLGCLNAFNDPTAQAACMASVIRPKARSAKVTDLGQFCQQACDSLDLLCGERRLDRHIGSGQNRLPFGLDDHHVANHMYGIQLDRLAACMDRVSDLLGFQSGSDVRSGEDAPCATLEEWACYVTHLMSEYQKKDPRFVGPHVAFAVCLAAVMSDIPAYNALPLVVEPIAEKRAINMHLPSLPQQAHMRQLATAALYDKKWVWVRNGLIATAVIAASGGLLTGLYFAAPSMLASVAFLANLSQLAQAAACWGMVMGACLCIAAAVFACRAACRAKQQKPLASGMERWGVFDQSVKDPAVSPRKPIMGATARLEA